MENEMKLSPQIRKRTCPTVSARRTNARPTYISPLRKYGDTSGHIKKRLVYNFIGQKILSYNNNK
jgi:hypothetical protein